jgi:ABC-type lipoprotein release transport system permease subunit
MAMSTTRAPSGERLRLTGAQALDFEVVGSLGREVSMVAHDLVLLRADDARRLLGLGPEQASDLAVRVFHDAEEQAIVPDLAAAFPWPVQIRQRTEMIGSYSAGAARRGSLAMLAMAPALVALVLLALAAWRDGLARRRELGLLKALGWTTSDVAKLRLLRAAIVGLPAVLVGMVVAYQLVFWPSASWAAELLLGWPGRPAQLTLEPASAALVLAQVGTATLLPWFAASLWPVLRVAASNPEQLLTQEPG